MEDSLIYKVARAYYEKGLTQQVIANRYGVSRIKVSRLLTKAKNEKIVQITINVPANNFSNLENEVEEKFRLDEVIIFEEKEGKTSNWMNVAGKVAAEYINSILNGNETVALTWGKTLLSVVNNLPANNYPDLKVVMALGGIGEQQSEYHGSDLTRKFAASFNTRPILIQSPGIVSSKLVCDELKNDTQIKEALQIASNADIAMLGLGRFYEDSPIVKQNIISKDNYQKMKQQGIVGDIALRFFNKEGKFVKSNLDERIIGLTAEEISGIRRKIGIAFGSEKYETIRAVAKGKLVNVLVTDDVTATKLLKED